MSSLYETDLTAWAEEQAEALRRLATEHPEVAAELDLPNLIDEVESMGASVERDPGDCQEFRVRAMGCASEVQAIWKRSSNRIASWALAIGLCPIPRRDVSRADRPHSLGGILHSRSAGFKTR